jgi:hypothetical protein
VGECIEGKQTCECTDVNDCGTVSDKPIEEWKCELVKPPIISPYWIIVGAIYVIAAVLMGFAYWKRVYLKKRLKTEKILANITFKVY